MTAPSQTGCGKIPSISSKCFIISSKSISNIFAKVLEFGGGVLVGGIILIVGYQLSTIAYNKLNANGRPIKGAGFSKEFDEPLMKILTTKLIISIKNANILKNLRDYQLIVESTPDPIIICSRDGTITYMNPGARNLFGDLLGDQVACHYPSDETSSGLDKAQEIKRLAKSSELNRVKNYETTFLSKTGEAIPVSISASMLYDEHGHETGTIGIAKDLRDTKALLATGQSLLDTHDTEKILQQITRVCLRLPNSIRAYI